VSVAEPVATPPRRRSFFRFWLPLILLALYGLALAAVWGWQDPDWPRVNRVASSIGLTMLTLLLFGLWFVAFSGVRWWLRVLVVAAVVAVVVVGPRRVVRDYHFSGNMVPVVHFIWEKPGDEAVETWRRQHADEKIDPPVDLAGDRATDYPGYRGRERDGVVHGPELARDWKSTPPRQLWRHPCGGGYAGFAIAGNNAVTIEQRGTNEAVVCYDTDTGLERWAHKYPAHFSEQMGGDGPRATPAIAGDDVYSLGAAGKLVCLEGATGKLKWQRDILEDNANIQWGMSGSPLVYEGFVVVNPGSQKTTAKYGGVAAFYRKTGELIWQAGKAKAGYSSPQLFTLAGKRQLLLFDGEGIAGYDPDKGTALWRHPWKTQPEINVAQPIVLPGDRVFISSAYGMGCAMLQVSVDDSDNWSVKELWKKQTMRCRFTSPVADAEYLYGLDEGILVCLDPKDGSRKWRGGRYDNGQLLRSGDLLVILAEDGELALVEVSGEGAHELGRFAALKGNTWNYPALADGKAYVRNDHDMACYDLRRTAR
jgi:outer membrane protein assembly factor BamB